MIAGIHIAYAGGPAPVSLELEELFTLLWGRGDRGRIALVLSSSIIADTAFIPRRVSSLPCKWAETNRS